MYSKTHKQTYFEKARLRKGLPGGVGQESERRAR